MENAFYENSLHLLYPADFIEFQLCPKALCTTEGWADLDEAFVFAVNKLHGYFMYIRFDSFPNLHS